jgi:hypothetical protein
MSGDRLFRPSESLTVPDLQNNTKDRGMFVVPPTYAELGGLKNASATGIYENNAKIRMPGNTEHSVPSSSQGNTQ